MAITYDKIATSTLSSAAASITLSSIAASWTDLVLVTTATYSSASGSYFMQFNGDTAANYARVFLGAEGNVASSGGTANTTNLYLGFGTSSTTVPFFYRTNIFSYAGATLKTLLSESSEDENGSGDLIRVVGLWRSTSAITSITIFASSGNFAAGTTTTLYGIKAA